MGDRPAITPVLENRALMNRIMSTGEALRAKGISLIEHQTHEHDPEEEQDQMIGVLNHLPSSNKRHRFRT